MGKTGDCRLEGRTCVASDGLDGSPGFQCRSPALPALESSGVSQRNLLTHNQGHELKSPETFLLICKIGILFLFQKFTVRCQNEKKKKICSFSSAFRKHLKFFKKPCYS